MGDGTLTEVERREAGLFDGQHPTFRALLAAGRTPIVFAPGPPLSRQRAIVLRTHLDGTVAIQPEFAEWQIVDRGRHLDEARARVSDPVTSHAAGAKLKHQLVDGRLKVLRALAAAGDYGMTDHDHFEVNGLEQDSAGKRRGELRDDLLVVDSGRTRMTPRGQRAKVWVITELGRQALRPPGPPSLDELLAGAAS